MSEAWLEIGRIKPQPRPYRTICSVPGCDMNERPADFAMRDTAEAWARDHADFNGHVVLIQERDEPTPMLGQRISREDDRRISRDGP